MMNSDNNETTLTINSSSTLPLPIVGHNQCFEDVNYRLRMKYPLSDRKVQESCWMCPPLDEPPDRLDEPS